MKMYNLMVRRTLAYVLDIVLLFIPLAALSMIVQRATNLVPESPAEVWMATTLTFSGPVWLYFILSDHSRLGASLGKRLLGVQVVAVSQGRVGVGQALARTALKLLPWELVHIFGFALAESLGSVARGIGLVVANVLTGLTFIVAVSTGGRRSVHDFIAGTVVGRLPR